MQAVSHAIGLGWDIDAQEMVPLARRIADGDLDYGGDLPDQNAYDGLHRPQGGEERRGRSPGFRSPGGAGPTPSPRASTSWP